MGFFMGGEMFIQFYMAGWPLEDGPPGLGSSEGHPHLMNMAILEGVPRPQELGTYDHHDPQP